MRQFRTITAISLIMLWAGLAGLGTVQAAAGGQRVLRSVHTLGGGGDPTPALVGRVVAVGIPGASAISPVGRFLPGGPLHDVPALAAATAPGQVLDPARILVASSSNFGAPPALSSQLPGAILSIDPDGAEPLAVPPTFAETGGQVSVLGGRVQLYTAQSAAFLNGVNNPNAETAGLPSVSNPLGLSLNNAFGRVWPANAPTGIAGPGAVTVLDPSGVPLAGAPSKQAGGVFAGDLTGRRPAQLLPGGIAAGAVGTALFGKSPDDSGRAVFVVVSADGSAVQVQTEAGVDGLLPAGFITSLLDHPWPTEGSPRVGVVLNFEPVRILYISDPLANAVVALTLQDDGRIFLPGASRRIESPLFDLPVDLAPARPETVDTDWASNTTLHEGADLYVLNGGNNTIVRLRQDGTVAAVRRVVLPGDLPLGDARLNGIAVSPDGARIWVTVSGSLPGFPGQDGAVLELPAFGAA